MRADIERREPRSHICCDETVRVAINELLDWHGIPIILVILGRGKTHLVTYADILRDLEPLNEGRADRDRITYDSLWTRQVPLRTRRDSRLQEPGCPRS